MRGRRSVVVQSITYWEIKRFIGRFEAPQTHLNRKPYLGAAGQKVVQQTESLGSHEGDGLLFRVTHRLHELGDALLPRCSAAGCI
jgi:hypothetical protein